MMPKVDIELVPIGHDAQDARAGDFIVCHREGFMSGAIRWGERLRLKNGDWSHAAYILDANTIAEALTHGVVKNPLSVYRHIQYAIVRTHMNDNDAAQANAFIESCIGQTYGYSTDIGIGLRFLTPGRGLWFGMNGTEICSGMVAQAEVRGWANFKNNPASLSPQELFDYFKEFV